MTTYRTPDPAWCGLTENTRRELLDRWGLRIYGANDHWYIVDGEDGWGPFTTRDDALVAWCLFTGRRHLVVVPTWEEPEKSLAEDWSYEVDAWGRHWLNLGAAPGPIDALPVADELDARWTVAVLQAIEAGLS